MNIGDLLGHWIGDSILPFFVTLITAALISQRNDYPRIKWLLFLIGGSILVVGIAIKLEWVFTVSIGGGLLVGWLLRSENRKNAAKVRNSAVATSALHKWFQSNRDQLSSEAYSPEFSAERAEQIVHQYPDLLARGGRGWIPDASNLPYEKETIRGAIDARIEYLIAQNGGRDTPPTPELERHINLLGAIKLELCEFQDIDPEDQAAVSLLNAASPSERDAPELNEKERAEFQRKRRHQLVTIAPNLIASASSACSARFTS